MIELKETDGNSVFINIDGAKLVQVDRCNQDLVSIHLESGLVFSLWIDDDNKSKLFNEIRKNED